MKPNQLGDYLRARRAQLLPSDVGIPTYGTRRVKGLRREEIAFLAGVSSDYYARLEQGRERHPSPQVLDAIARAMNFDDDARTHLFLLAGASQSRSRTPAREWVSPALLELMDNFTTTPAFVINRAHDLLAMNSLARVLYSPFTLQDNLVRMIFLDSAGTSFYGRWDGAAQATVAHVRDAMGHDPQNARIRELVDELTAESERFAELWDQYEVRGKTKAPKDLFHPAVGPLVLTYQAFDVRDAPGQQLITYHAEPHSSSAQALTLLSTLAGVGQRHDSGQSVPN
ncbi:putative DNA-binding protein [Pseudarthrobacter siccitolerans]|uniref:Putative DNA-binding protein n=1 Tax=Pseudarthrobacter siccitolerans TaxID=861266 RepID=A0A024H2A8_9MICC|nr:helix-turn-helix transcriptional regulator [Pseudarthrobacter siccitolerans]CCQ46148.1 putative DNA-binding protein [Pseudarthrobacter siccitolerans]